MKASVTPRKLQGLISLRTSSDCHVLRWNAREPLPAYIELERWFRDGLMCPHEFVCAIKAVGKMAIEAKEGAK